MYDIGPLTQVMPVEEEKKTYRVRFFATNEEYVLASVDDHYRSMPKFKPDTFK